MIWHYYVIIKYRVWETFRDFLPTFFDNIPSLIQMHFTINNLAKGIFMTLGINCYKIFSRLRLVILFKTNRFSLVYLMHIYYVP